MLLRGPHLSQYGSFFESCHGKCYCDPEGGQRGACLDVREMPGTMAPLAVAVTAPTHMAGLYVVATMNKEDVVVVWVPFSSL